MASDPLDSRADHARNAVFATTHWSLVLKAGEVPGDESDRALDSLCRGYWYPLYAYIRRLGHSPHDAQDLTQSYFAYLLEKRLLTKADPVLEVSPRSAFAKRFGTPLPRPRKPTKIAQTLIEDRGE